MEKYQSKDLEAFEVLSQIVKFLSDEVITKITRSVGESHVDIKDISFVMTMPSKWGDEGILLLKDAAAKVSFNIFPT